MAGDEEASLGYVGGQGSPAGARRRPNIYDVARVSGVSPTTVSHALTGHGRVHPDTRERVRAVASSLGYHANPAAQYLANGSSGTIGLCLPETGINLAYYHEVALGAAEQALSHGLALTLIPALEDPSRLARYTVDAFMVMDPRHGDPMLDALRQLQLPVVTGDRDLSPAAAWAGLLETDHHDAFGELLDHMYANGARRFAAVVSGPERAWMANSLATYKEWCRLHDVPPRTTQVPFISTPGELRLAGWRLLGSKRLPDAIVGIQEESALGVLSVATERGIRVPDEVMLASCVDSGALVTAWPSVTALDLQPRIFGARLVDLVVRALGGERQATGSVKARLRIRASTRRSTAHGRTRVGSEGRARERAPLSRIS